MTRVDLYMSTTPAIADVMNGSKIDSFPRSSCASGDGGWSQAAGREYRCVAYYDPVHCTLPDLTRWSEN
jgi:hypothetical protein